MWREEAKGGEWEGNLLKTGATLCFRLTYEGTWKSFTLRLCSYCLDCCRQEPAWTRRDWQWIDAWMLYIINITSFSVGLLTKSFTLKQKSTKCRPDTYEPFRHCLEIFCSLKIFTRKCKAKDIMLWWSFQLAGTQKLIRVGIKMGGAG